ncbi:NAD(P)/FAD-dependent oxidoreductase [Aureliella helgolandensis]|uniref:Dihydrolipoamide dehydrogenase n=1 Tax=Aureliella helgolandensis TaxID=2527968 RepID=A0A518G8N5_9BACT|nr:NAD(P)/FAD-dependent oxidoreductase [Aureliella helgolandensis]QDV24942.1 dihydrolipoamide dehydrogenase [Aureliella helgolandensis]
MIRLGQPPIETWDVVVVGAGPAGSAAAISLARLGQSVLLLDSKKFPRHKICGGCMNQVSITLLKSLIGSDHRFWTTGNPLESFSLHHRGRTFSVATPTGFAIERSLLDQCLVDCAIEAGVTFRDSTFAKLGEIADDYRLLELSRTGQSSVLRAKAVVIASGLNNRCVGAVEDLQQVAARNSRVGVETIIFKDSLPASFYAASRNSIQMALGACGYVGITALPEGRLHIAASVDRTHLRQQGPLGTVMHILREACCAEVPIIASDWRGSPLLTARARRLAAPRVFLVGDAAGYVEPFTGEGIRWALQSGIGVTPFVQAAVEAWRIELVDDWEHWHRKHIGCSQKLCSRLTRLLKSPAACWTAHQALRLQPWLAGEVVKRLNQTRENHQ